MVPLRVLKSKMTSVRGLGGTFWGIEPKNMRGSKINVSQMMFVFVPFVTLSYGLKIVHIMPTKQNSGTF